MISQSSKASDLLADHPCTVVGIGASAGGLEALEQFFENVPPDSGLAFVVVQHLDPNRQGMLVELLQRSTPMPVREITDRTPVKANHVFVIPPNKDLSIKQGVLRLLTRDVTHKLRLPIDSFFKTLAEDQMERGLGVILSGMGSDGTRGLGAIKQQAGAVFVQDPASAKFDGMPRSAINAGLADVVASAELLPTRILAYLAHMPALTAAAGSTLDPLGQTELVQIIGLIRSGTGHDLSLYKKSTITRRIERRMGLHRFRKSSCPFFTTVSTMAAS